MKPLVAGADGDRRPASALAVVQTQLDDPLTQIAVQRPEVHGLDHRLARDAAPGEHVTLQGDSAEVMALGGADGNGLTHVVEGVEDILHLAGVQGPQVHTAPGGHE